MILPELQNPKCKILMTKNEIIRMIKCKFIMRKYKYELQHLHQSYLVCLEGKFLICQFVVHSHSPAAWALTAQRYVIIVILILNQILSIWNYHMII